MNKPLLGITMGDPAGVGPEVIAGSWLVPQAEGLSRRFVIGSSSVMQAAVELLGLPIYVDSISRLDQMELAPDRMPVLEIQTRCESVLRCQVSAVAGRAAVEAVTTATRMALTGEIDGIVTAPLNKAAIHAAGINLPGHTEMLAQQCGVSNVAMMLYLPTRRDVSSSSVDDTTGNQDIGLGVVHVTLHTALRNIFTELSIQGIVDRCHLATRFTRAMLEAAGLTRLPRVGVAALNPHGGEGGLFGREEIELIGPAVKIAQDEGCPVMGPLPCDTLMHRAAGGEFDSVVAMYHDQGHIALKLLGLQRAVNITLGLPIVRTSVAHGTAFDIAWKARAQSGSMVEAITVAAKLSRHRQLLIWK